MGSHHLPVEEGRHFNLPRASRVCKLCNTDALGLRNPKWSLVGGSHRGQLVVPWKGTGAGDGQKLVAVHRVGASGGEESGGTAANNT
ncbi:hypothetical protein WJX84_006030 [Apatococcus fuscideae]|uniref:Uncharacterized protein n=1 Tax=Apatococcus fuscideae TaxID=2026836 RepID=A0AAW1TAS7_9CHLO